MLIKTNNQESPLEKKLFSNIRISQLIQQAKIKDEKEQLKKALEIYHYINRTDSKKKFLIDTNSIIEGKIPLSSDLNLNKYLLLLNKIFPSIIVDNTDLRLTADYLLAIYPKLYLQAICLSNKVFIDYLCLIVKKTITIRLYKPLRNTKISNAKNLLHSTKKILR